VESGYALLRTRQRANLVSVFLMLIKLCFSLEILVEAFSMALAC
jgi:hypothetical protein